MYYKLTKSYTHHGGKKLRLSEITEGTIVQKDSVVEDNPGFEYLTISFGDEPQYYLSADVVENSEEYFEPISREDYVREIGSRELINVVLLNQERGITPEESAEIILNHFDLEEEFELDFEDEDLDSIYNPNESLRKAAEEFKKELERLSPEKHYPNFQPFSPTVPNMPISNPTAPYCHCGNDGSKPCWSTSCPKQLIISYTVISSNNKPS